MSGSDIIEAPETPEPDMVTDEGPEPIPLLCPAEGVPALSVTADDIAAAADRLASGTGPFAVDAERASGFRYSNRAYLIQIRRTGAGTVLIDPVNHGGSPIDALAPVAEVLAEDEWILHAADQDLPCLAEVGLRPPALYDTELAGRLGMTLSLKLIIPSLLQEEALRLLEAQGFPASRNGVGLRVNVLPSAKLAPLRLLLERRIEVNNFEIENGV